VVEEKEEEVYSQGWLSGTRSNLNLRSYRTCLNLLNLFLSNNTRERYHVLVQVDNCSQDRLEGIGNIDDNSCPIYAHTKMKGPKGRVGFSQDVPLNVRMDGQIHTRSPKLSLIVFLAIQQGQSMQIPFEGGML
jgi:hypothetical protein